MSAFVSMVSPAGCYLWTDGAVWDRTMSLAQIRTKVLLCETGHLAVTTRGDLAWGESVARKIVARANQAGVAKAFADLQAIADDERASAGVVLGVGGIDVFVTGWLEGVGGTHRLFRSYDQETYARPGDRVKAAQRKPYEVFEPNPIFWSGSAVREHEWARLGLEPRPGERPLEYGQRLGMDLMEAMRFRPGPGQDGSAIHCVGGKVDFTVIGEHGAHSRTLREWPDPVGERIDPYRGMNRAERRRIERWIA